MRILSWNCQGLGNPMTVQALRAIVAQDKPDLIFLMETRNQESVIQQVQRRLKYNNSFVVNPQGLAGGMVLFWTDQISLTITHSTPHLIDTFCSENGGINSMCLTALHAPATFHQRQLLWADLRHLRHSNTQPWICLGDFNEVLYSWEKISKRHAESYRMQSFRDVLYDCALMDLETKGCAYTWANNRSGEDLVRERLDRAVCNIEWRLAYPEAEVVALPAIASDHSPILLTTQLITRKGKRNFTFEAFWIEHEECRQVVEDAWSASYLRNSSISRRLQVTKTALTRWSNSTFKDNHRKLHLLQQQLQFYINQPAGNYDEQQVSNLKNQIQQSWSQEEQYWGMRSRIRWLRWGDRNTSFFHATTVQRRKRNRISMLKTENDEWIRDPEQLKNMTVSFFTKLYTSCGPRAFELILSQCSKVVTDSMNATLTAAVTREEVKNATFQLGATQAPGPDGLNGLFYHTYWDLIQDDVFHTVQNFFLTGNMPADLNKTALSHAPQSLWATVFKALYFRSTTLWKANTGMRPSWGWRSILMGRDSILDGLK